MAVAVKPKIKRKGFSPFSLDAVNFLSADVRGAVGPYLNVFLVTRQHWSQSEVGLVITIGRQRSCVVLDRVARRIRRLYPSDLGFQEL
jgi:hypothetical protein